MLDPRCGYLILGVLDYTEAHLVPYEPDSLATGCTGAPGYIVTHFVRLEPILSRSPIPYAYWISGPDVLLIAESGKNDYKKSRSSSDAVGGCFFKTTERKDKK